MQPISPFPLLRLSPAVFSELLRIANPIETIILSFCSRKTWDLIKKCRDKSINWEIELIGWDKPEIHLSYRIMSPYATTAPRFKNFQEDSQGSLTAQDFTLPSTFTLWNKEIYLERFTSFAKYLAYLFDKPIYKIIGKWQDEHWTYNCHMPWESSEIIIENEGFQDNVLKIGDFAVSIIVQKGIIPIIPPPFPLLRLPPLALSEILKIASPSEVIALSLCSQKTRKRVKAWRDKSIDCEIALSSGRSPAVFLIYKDVRIRVLGAFTIDTAMESSEVLKIEELKVPIEMKFEIDCGRYLVTFWENDKWIEGFKWIVSYVLDFFEKPVHRVGLHWENRWLIEWINERQTERLKEGYIGNGDDLPVTDDDFHNLIKMFTPTRSLMLDMELPNTFRLTRRIHDVEDIYITFGSWVTIHNLLAINAVSLIVDLGNLTVSDMNAYIKHWLAGGSPRLKYANLYIRGDANLEQLHEGFAERVVEVPRLRQYKIPCGEVQQFVGYDITRADGVTATISHGMIAVWPDLDGSYN